MNSSEASGWRRWGGRAALAVGGLLVGGVLVDRVWPRGLTKDKARLDQWFKQVAPSTELRRWYSHDPERFEQFGRRYREELKDAGRAQALKQLRELAKRGTLTLLTATKHAEISEAAVLADLIRG